MWIPLVRIDTNGEGRRWVEVPSPGSGAGRLCHGIEAIGAAFKGLGESQGVGPNPAQCPYDREDFTGFVGWSRRAEWGSGRSDEGTVRPQPARRGGADCRPQAELSM